MSRCICAAMGSRDYELEPAPGCPVHDPRSAGEPPAEQLAEVLADVVVVDGPHRGSVWSYEASHGGYMRTDPRGRAADDTICTDVAALLAHTGAQVVRPLPRREAP